jgi:hypothetical protein
MKPGRQALLLMFSLLPAVGAACQSTLPSCLETGTGSLRKVSGPVGCDFEPSGVVFSGDCEVVVVSDKVDGLELESYSLAKGPVLSRTHVSATPGTRIKKFEAMTPALDGRGFLVVTSGSFKGASFVPQDQEDRAVQIAKDPTSGQWVAVADHSFGYSTMLGELRKTFGGYLKVEALATLETSYLVGIRQFGLSYEQFDYGVLLVEWDPAHSHRPRLVANPGYLTFEEDSHFRTYAVAGLDCIRSGGGSECYMLVSSETGPRASDVSSRLYRFDPASAGGALSVPGTLLRCWEAKAEGVAISPGGRAFVVFDSDGDRKAQPAEPGKFDLAPNEDWFWLGDIDPSEDPERCIGPAGSHQR